MKKKSRDNRTKKKHINIFISIVISVLITPVSIGILSLVGFYKDKEVQHSQVVGFYNKIDIGSREDGYYYSIVCMFMDSESGITPKDGPLVFGKSYEYVILKKAGTYPEVKYVEYYPETGPINSYVISDTLISDDFSDIITEKIINDHNDIFADKDGLSFRVVDMDKDIIMSAEKTEELRESKINRNILLTILYFLLRILLPIIVIISIILIGIVIIRNIFQKD